MTDGAPEGSAQRNRRATPATSTTSARSVTSLIIAKVTAFGHFHPTAAGLSGRVEVAKVHQRAARKVLEALAPDPDAVWRRWTSSSGLSSQTVNGDPAVAAVVWRCGMRTSIASRCRRQAVGWLVGSQELVEVGQLVAGGAEQGLQLACASPRGSPRPR